MIRSALITLALGLVQLALVLILSPLLLGIVSRVKAMAAGRVGPPLLQLYYDLAKLARKDAVFSRSTTWVFLVGPLAAVAIPASAALLVPMGSGRGPLGFTGDLILFAYLFAMARFLTVLSALDTGSSFEGMGAAREVAYSALAEPALFLGLAALASFSGSLSLGPLLTAAGQGWGVASGPLILVLAGWALVFLVENCRIPFDDPNTHLELTMIHEVMVLDHSGPPLGLVLYGASMKFMVLGTLLVKVCLPTSGNPWIDWPAFLLGLGALAVGVGLVESVMARLRLNRVPQLLVVAVLSCAFAFLMLLLQPVSK
ncbi:MAG: NADH-quinone oxidoreductase subunit H [Holophaga sp.]|nr:NADH-quinone oxidoreductase subunit H [Holophaga sp.]